MLHIVLMKTRSSASAKDVAELRSALADLPTAIPGIASFAFGPNISPEGLGREYDLGFVMAFGSKAARDAYLPHPAHLAVVPLVERVAEQVLVFDVESGDA
jgi:hypothetical protein